MTTHLQNGVNIFIERSTGSLTSNLPTLFRMLWSRDLLPRRGRCRPRFQVEAKDANLNLLKLVKPVPKVVKRVLFFSAAAFQTNPTIDVQSRLSSVWSSRSWSWSSRIAFGQSMLGPLFASSSASRRRLASRHVGGTLWRRQKVEIIFFRRRKRRPNVDISSPSSWFAFWSSH